MSYKYSKISLKNLKTCDDRLQRLFNEVISHWDCTILEGHRSNERQEELFTTGFSRVRGGQSSHNLQPSKAIDVSPFPINWKDEKRFILFSGFVKGVASQMDIKIRWGGDWDSDNCMKDQRFNDLVHFELID